MLSAHVKTAFVYRCPICDWENFVRSVIHEFDPNEPIDDSGLCVPAVTGNWLTHPDSDDCNGCGRAITLRNVGQED